MDVECCCGLVASYSCMLTLDIYYLGTEQFLTNLIKFVESPLPQPQLSPVLLSLSNLSSRQKLLFPAFYSILGRALLPVEKVEHKMSCHVDTSQLIC